MFLIDITNNVYGVTSLVIKSCSAKSKILNTKSSRSYGPTKVDIIMVNNYRTIFPHHK